MKNYGIGAIALMVGLGGLVQKNPDPSKMVNTPMVKYKTAKVKAQYLKFRVGMKNFPTKKMLFTLLVHQVH